MSIDLTTASVYVLSAIRTALKVPFANTNNNSVEPLNGNNTASGAYSTILNGKDNVVSGDNSIILGGNYNVANGVNSFVGLGKWNGAECNCSTVINGCANCACGNFTSVVGGYRNTATSNFSFVAGGSGNNTRGFDNTFILGSNLFASASSTTFVNNLSSQGFVYGDGSSLTNILTSVYGTDDQIVATINRNNNSFELALAKNIITKGNVDVNGDLTVNGSLLVRGTNTMVETSSTLIKDPLIYLADGNTINDNDIGFVGSYNNGLQQTSGLVRSHLNDNWTLFSGVTSSVASNVVPTNDSTYKLDTLVANISAKTVASNSISNTGTITTDGINSTSLNSTEGLFQSLSAQTIKVTTLSATTLYSPNAVLTYLSVYFVRDNSGITNFNWSSTYSCVSSLSSNWSNVYSTTKSLSSNWSNVYTLTNANSAKWDSGGGVYTTVNANSAKWDSGGGVYTTVNANSADWENVYTYVNQTSGTIVSKLSTIPFTIVDSTSSIQPIRGFNTASGSYSLVAGGVCNSATGVRSSVVNGCCNIAKGCTAFIGSGRGNIAVGNCSSIVGGVGLSAIGVSTFIAGGCLNRASGIISFIGGGQCNCTGVFAFGSSILGGSCNKVNGSCSIIMGGVGNCALSADSVIGGGYYNCTTARLAGVFAGSSNTASGYESVVVGGQYNCADVCLTFVGGGSNNCALTIGSSVVGGLINTASGCYSIVGGGEANTATGDWSFIGGGCCNTALSSSSVIVGGHCNTAYGCRSVITGGRNNISCGDNSFIGSGYNNSIYKTISPNGNATETNYTIIAGGQKNKICSVSPYTDAYNNYSTIVNGLSNIINSSISNFYSGTNTSFASIVGGCKNTICGGLGIGGDYSSGYYSVILGGHDNTVYSTNSFVLGSNITTTCNNYTYVNNLSATGRICGIHYGDGSNLTGLAEKSYKRIYVDSILPVEGTNIISTTNSNYIHNNVITGGASNSIYSNDEDPTLCSNFIGAGYLNKICGSSVYCNSILNGVSNTISGTVRSTILGGGYNNVQGSDSTIGGGCNNTVSSNYSFIAAGNWNDTKGFDNTFIVGTGLSASCTNYTYVNNLSSQGKINTNSIVFADGSTQTTAGGFELSGTSYQINVGKNGSKFTFSLPQSAVFPGDVIINGTLTANGSATIINATNLEVNDNLIYLNKGGEGSNTLDVGFVSNFKPVGGVYNHTGLIRKSGQGIGGVWTLFSGLTSEPLTATNINWDDVTLTVDTLSANVVGSLSGVHFGDGSRLTGGPYTFLAATSSIIPTVGNHCTLGSYGGFMRYATIGGGICNTICGDSAGQFYTTIGGGCCNTAAGLGNTIGGGLNNSATSENGQSTIGGGLSNKIVDTTIATIGGGQLNCIDNRGYGSTIGGGTNNYINSGNPDQTAFAVIGGGSYNTINKLSNNSTIGGGSGNNTSGCYNAIVGGLNNGSAGNFTFMGAGSGSIVSASYGVSVGGRNNYICNTAGGGVIVGGARNTVSGLYGSVIGGVYNTISGAYSFIAGGCSNNTKGFNNTFLLGSGLSATQANTTYVNNLNSQGFVTSSIFYGASGLNGHDLLAPTFAGAGGYIDLRGGDGFVNDGENHIQSGDGHGATGGYINLRGGGGGQDGTSSNGGIIEMTGAGGGDGGGGSAGRIYGNAGEHSGDAGCINISGANSSSGGSIDISANGGAGITIGATEPTGVGYGHIWSQQVENSDARLKFRGNNGDSADWISVYGRSDNGKEGSLNLSGNWNCSTSGCSLGGSIDLSAPSADGGSGSGGSLCSRSCGDNFGGTLNMSAGIYLSGGSINTSNGGGNIDTTGGGHVCTGLNGSASYFILTDADNVKWKIGVDTSGNFTNYGHP
jgi:hypothetical protein